MCVTHTYRIIKDNGTYDFINWLTLLERESRGGFKRIRQTFLDPGAL